MSWDSWAETQRKNEEHRKRVEADRQQREKRLADERKKMVEDRAKAKEKKKIELQKKSERDEKQRKRIEQSNAAYDELLNGPKKEEQKPQVSLNKFCGMRGGGSQGGFGQASRSSQHKGGGAVQGGGSTQGSGPQAPGQSNQSGRGSIVSSALSSGFRRF